ncbi:MFHAS1 [Branchiostoma lanceolatum]|uniref:MFHAS1 protein n=1 Tax=Branchiostoma lanceolatum TaxID=7740 RepID=A0A8K0EK52_BRALA|nr:MFHAS1 [Branchiostoma lanceolatum]
MQMQVPEKLFHNGQASWRDAETALKWTEIEKLEFPDCSFEWKSLTDGTYSLVMKSKDPPCIPDFLRNDPRTPKVSQLHLSVNRMKKIPAGISIFSEVTDVKLDRNKLKSLTPEFTQLKKIKNLDLGNNIFKTFPSEIKEFGDLEVLRFSVNQVEEIPAGVFPRLPNLRNLRIGSNKLKSLPEDLVSLEKLEYLKISSNKFAAFPPQLLQLPSIRQVCLSANKITEVPLEFFEKPLELFQAEDNPLSEPPQEVCMQGVTAIKQYIKSLKSGFTEDNRLKLMLLGDTGAGKTSLCLSLKTGESYLVDIRDRTHGIDRHDITEGDVTFLTWDFAGQQDYLVTHPVFITKDALVLLVVNLEKYELKDEESYRRHVGVWIDNISMRVPDAAVLVVGTHLDKVTAGDAQEKLAEILDKIKKEQERRLKMIKRHISQLKKELDRPDSGRTEVVMDLLASLEEKQGISLRVHSDGIPLSSTPGLQGFDGFKQTVISLAQTYLQQTRRKIPASWTQVEKVMKPPEQRNAELHTAPGVINIDEAVDDILRGSEVTTPHEAKVVLRYLHGLGLLIWYSKIDCLKTYVFVDPAVLVDVFKACTTCQKFNLFYTSVQVVIRDGLQEELGSITIDQAADEGMTSTKLKKQLKNFIDKKKALLGHKILSILWKKAKVDKTLNVAEDVTLLVKVLEQFQLCFTYTPAEPDSLNPAANEFHPGSPWAPPGNKAPVTRDDLRKSTMYLFPCYLHDTLPQQNGPTHVQQTKSRSGTISNLQALPGQVGLTFFPEVPYGFFERLCVCLHQLSPGLKLWKDSAKLCQNNVSMVLMKHRGQQGDRRVNDLPGVWNDPTIEMVARGNKPDPDDPISREPLWDPVLRVLGVAQSLLTSWPGVNIDMFSLCPGCEPDAAELFDVPLPVKLERHCYYVYKVTSFNNIMQTMLDTCIPYKKKKTRNVDKYWMTDKIKSALEKRQSAFQKHGKTPRWKKLRNQVQALIRKQKRHHYSRCIGSLKKQNPRDWWNFVNNELGRTQKSKRNIVLTNVPEDQVADQLSNFFSEAMSHSSTFAMFPLKLTDASCDLCSIGQVKAALKTLNPRQACGPDNIPNWVLSLFCEDLSPVICHLMNTSYNMGIMPSPWKTANICPVPKTAHPTSKKDWRPISLISTLGKVQERFVLNRFLPLIKPWIKDQFAYMPKSSTTAALVKAYQSWLTSVDNKQPSVVRVLLADMSKAFDKVDHGILLQQLSTRGIPTTILTWINSYLSGRKQRVAVNGQFSKWQDVTSGVPQGGVLSPYLFLVYMSTRTVKHPTTSNIGYADDIGLSRCIPCVTAEQDNTMQDEATHLDSWATQNNMTMNGDKSYELRICFSRVPPDLPPLILGGKEVAVVTCATYLGFKISSNLKWDSQVAHVTKKGSQRLHFLRLLAKGGMPPDDLTTVYTTLIRPVVEYANVVYVGCTNSQSNALEAVQRRAVKIINKAGSTTTANLLPTLQSRREVAAVALLNQMRSSDHPLHHMVTDDRQQRTGRTLRNCKHLTLTACRTERLRKSFLYQATKLYNQAL